MAAILLINPRPECVYSFHQEELKAPTFNYYFNSVEEFTSPLIDKNSAVYGEGLRLLSLETKIIPCRFQEKLQKYGINGTYCISLI